jgi:hypothetical protein
MCTVKCFKGFAENVEGFVGCFDVGFVSAPFEGPFVFVPTGKRRHVRMIPKMDYAVRPAIQYVLSDPSEMVVGYTVFGLRVWDDQMCSHH